jgi:predicted RNase H-like HicB family nuclease
MNTTDRYLKFIQWNEEDALYVGYCPDLFPWGGVCHGVTEEVEELIRAGKPLPEPVTRPMREAVLA